MIKIQAIEGGQKMYSNRSANIKKKVLILFPLSLLLFENIFWKYYLFFTRWK